MPQQHPGRLQILVVDAHCKRRLFSTKTPTDPDELARRFCTPDNCLVVVLRDNRFLFRLERAPGSHCRWHKGRQLPPSASTGLAIMNATEANVYSFPVPECSSFWRTASSY
nr:PilI type IV pilus biogenesis protein [Escherichia coli]